MFFCYNLYMEFIFKLLTFLNSIGIAYLIFLFYKKNLPKQADLKSKQTLDSQLKIKLVRFNPFDEIGSNQSFILCLLDMDNSGVIITSLHSRDQTRIYAKEIKEGNIDPNIFSKKEKEILSKIIKN
jgi:hypothetical protein